MDESKMNREKLVELVKEAGGFTGNWQLLGEAALMGLDKIEKFAELVRKDYSFTHAQTWLKRFDDAIKSEREACAVYCELLEDEGGEYDVQQQCANAIRARGQK
jgi:hypothetical protein